MEIIMKNRLLANSIYRNIVTSVMFGVIGEFQRSIRVDFCVKNGQNNRNFKLCVTLSYHVSFKLFEILKIYNLR